MSKTLEEIAKERIEKNDRLNEKTFSLEEVGIDLSEVEITEEDGWE